MQLVAKVEPDEHDPTTHWLSLSGGGRFGFLIRHHSGEDSEEHLDQWAQSLDDAMGYGDAYGVSQEDWHEPARVWANAPPPVDFKGD